MFSTKKGELIAHDSQTRKKLYFLDSEGEPPESMQIEDPTSLLQSEDLLKVFRKFSVSKKDINKILDFYKDCGSGCIECSDWKLRQAFLRLDQMMLDQLRRFHIDNSANFELSLDPATMLSHAFVGATRSGKTFAACQILLRFPNIKVYVFTLNPNDSTLAILRTGRPKKNTCFVDLERINSELDLKTCVDPGSILLFDDTLELPATNPLKGILRKLMDQTLSRGRHHRNKQRGCTAMICCHLFRNGVHSRRLWNEISYLTIFRSSSPNLTREFLIKGLGIHRNDVDTILKYSKGSRSITLHVQGRPQFGLWDTGALLL